MKKVSITWKTSVVTYTICLEIDGKEYDITVIREDVPNMGGHTENTLTFPEGFPADKKAEAQEWIDENIEMYHVFEEA